MRLFLFAIFSFLAAIGPAAAQRAGNTPASTANPQERIALAGADEAADRPLRLACAPLAGQVFDADGRPLAGATLLVQGTQRVYVTDAGGQFRFTEPVYQDQVLTVQAAGYVPREVPLADCTLPRLVLEQAAGARIKRSGTRAGQVTRLDNRSTTLR